MIADPALHRHRPLAAEVVLRTILVALVAALILWALPAMTELAG